MLTRVWAAVSGLPVPGPGKAPASRISQATVSVTRRYGDPEPGLLAYRVGSCRLYGLYVAAPSSRAGEGSPERYNLAKPHGER